MRGYFLRSKTGKFFLLGLGVICFCVSCAYKPVQMSSFACRPVSCGVDFRSALMPVRRDGGVGDAPFRDDFHIQMDGQTRISYSFYANLFQNVGVSGRCDDGSNYFVRIDSGFPWYVGLTDTIVADEKLAICAINDVDFPVGICRLGSLGIGDMVIKNPPALYFEQHWEFQVLGVPVWQERGMLIGLRLMEMFPYVLFDTSKGEVEFGDQYLFEPDGGNWKAFEMRVANDPQNQRRLMVDLPVGDQIISVWFDTGNPGGLEVSSSVWQKISRGLDVKSSRKSNVLYWQFGSVVCDKVVLRRLPLGFKTIKNAQVVVLPDGRPFYDSYGVIGMDIFDGDVVVIDFARNLLWVKLR